MADDIKQLLRDAADSPTRPVDAAQLVRRARRERRLVGAGTAAAGSMAAIIAAVVLMPSPLGGEVGPVVTDRPDQVTDGPTEETQPANDLWNRTYESVEVEAPSTGRQLVEGTNIRLTLTRGMPFQEVEGDLEIDETAHGFAAWQAGCNEGHQQVRVVGDELELVGLGWLTYMLCQPTS